MKKTKPTRKPNPRAKTAARKQTSDRVSSDASRLLHRLSRGAQAWTEETVPQGNGEFCVYLCNITSVLKSACASALSQDETKGKRRARA
jgi:hypothetical protein